MHVHNLSKIHRVYVMLEQRPKTKLSALTDASLKKAVSTEKSNQELTQQLKQISQIQTSQSAVFEL